MDFTDQSIAPAASSLAVALGVGLLIGIERERRKGEGPQRGAAGVRTFAVTAVLGTMSALTGNTVALAAVALGVVVLVALSYSSTREADPGLTTEAALLATFVIGVLATTNAPLAGACGVLISLLLVSRTLLHRFALQMLSHQELQDALLLAAAAMIVLPLLPDRALDPWSAINLHVVWRLTVLVMLVNALGYVAQRALGARYGLPLSGLLGGFVSSTAVVAAMGRRAKEDPEVMRPAVAAATLSSIATFVELALILAVVDARLLGALYPSLIAAGVVAALFGLFFMRQAIKASTAKEMLPGRAFRFSTALLFAALFSGLSIVAVLLQKFFGTEGALVGAAAGGFIDAHSTSAAVGNLVAKSLLDPRSGAIGVAFVVSANSLSKAAFAYAGGRAYFLRVAPSLAAAVAVFWVMLI